MRWSVGLLAFVSGILVPRPGDAQPANREPRWRVGIEMIRSRAWDLEIRTGSFLNRAAGYDAGWSAGLRVGFDPIRELTAFGAFEWNGGGFGDTSGWSLWDLGVEVRPIRLRTVIPRIIATVGNASESGGVIFGIGTFGAGIDVPLGRHFAAGAAARYLVPFSPRARDQPVGGGSRPTATVNADMLRLHLGLTVRL
jgi:hypothetical protein